MNAELFDYLKAEYGRAAAVARESGLAAAFLSQIANGLRPAPPMHCAAIEQATGNVVRRWHLRPTDWHRIWPELVGSEGAPPVPVTPVTPVPPPRCPPLVGERAAAREFARDLVQREIDRITHAASAPPGGRREHPGQGSTERSAHQRERG